jgi:hypothetical protein
VRNALNKFCIASSPRFQSGVELTHSFLMFLNELDGCFNNDVVEKTFHNSPRCILRVNIETEPRTPSIVSLGPVIAIVMFFAPRRRDLRT